MATSKQIKHFMNANNATREEAETHFKNAAEPKISEPKMTLDSYVHLCGDQNKIQSKNPIMAMSEFGGVMGVPGLIEGDHTQKSTYGICNFQIFEGTATTPKFAGNTVRGAIYQLEKIFVSAYAQPNEWYVIFEHALTKTQLVLAVKWPNKPTQNEAKIWFNSAAQVLKGTPAMDFLKKSLENQPMKFFGFTTKEAGLGNIGFAELVM